MDMFSIDITRGTFWHIFLFHIHVQSVCPKSKIELRHLF